MWRCDEITFLLQDPETIQSMFPVCVNATRPKRTFIPVHASIHKDPINFGSTYRVTFGKWSTVPCIGLSDPESLGRYGLVARHLDTPCSHRAICELPERFI